MKKSWLITALACLLGCNIQLGTDSEFYNNINYNTEFHTKNGEGHFVASGTGLLSVEGTGEAYIHFLTEEPGFLEFDADASMIIFKSAGGKYWHIISKSPEKPTTITIEGEAEVSLRGEGFVYYNGTGWVFAYRD